MEDRERHTIAWEHRQAELWDRIFQVTQDVVGLADMLGDDAGSAVVKSEMVKSAMAVGAELVRANAADTSAPFRGHVTEARMKAIETDYWLRMAYVLQQRDDVQRDLSSIITQYSAIIEMLQTFVRHVQHERDAVARHTKGPRISG